MLIRQIRSLGSLLKTHGVHAGLIARKPEVVFKTPTYSIGGSNYSSARQGGFLLLCVWLAGFFVRKINKKIEDLGFEYIGEKRNNIALYSGKTLHGAVMKRPIRLTMPLDALTLNS